MRQELLASFQLVLCLSYGLHVPCSAGCGSRCVSREVQARVRVDDGWVGGLLVLQCACGVTSTTAQIESGEIVQALVVAAVTFNVTLACNLITCCL